jgi:hypothetical protein
MKRLAMIIILAFTLAGCASTDYKAYLTAQQAAIRDAQAAQRPLFELEGEPGQPITGLRAVRVYMPVQAPVIQQSRPSEWAAVLGNGLQILGVVAGIKYSGEAASNLAREVGGAANHGYQFVQSPQANQSVGTGILGTGIYTGELNGVLGSGARTDSTHAPTVVYQPDPAIVTQPTPVIVEQPAPIVVEQPPPLVVEPPAPIVVPP